MRNLKVKIKIVIIKRKVAIAKTSKMVYINI